MTPYGEASVAWRKVAGKVEADIVVPVGAEAVVTLPGSPEKVLGSGRHKLTGP